MNEFQLPDGTTRRLGNIVPLKDTIGPVFGEATNTRLIPRSRWDSLLANYQPGPDHPFLPPVHDQNGVGQCNASATVAAMEFCRAMQGLPHVSLSAADLYHRINGGRDQGSLLADGIREAVGRGVGTTQTSGYLWKSGSWKGPAPDAERARYRVIEAYLCPTFDHCFSAVLQGFALISGIMWYSNYNPDRDGWLPQGSGGAGGHAVFGYKPTKRGSTYGIWHQNSWSAGWGLSGRCVFPEPSYAGPVGGWWAVRAIVDEGIVRAMVDEGIK